MRRILQSRLMERLSLSEQKVPNQSVSALRLAIHEAYAIHAKELSRMKAERERKERGICSSDQI